MKRRDRKNTWEPTVLVKAPKWNSRVMVAGHGAGTVEDPGFTHTTVRLDKGELVKVPHADVTTL